jgi:hypothetical protein
MESQPVRQARPAVAVAVAVTTVVALVAPVVAVVEVRASLAFSIFEHLFLHLRVGQFLQAMEHLWFSHLMKRLARPPLPHQHSLFI